ncbi:MAG: cell division protein FtsQ [Clostridium sp.]
MRTRKMHGKRVMFFSTVLLVLFLTILILSIRISTVTVSGNVRYTSEQIEQIVFDSSMSRNPFYCYYRYKFQPHKQIPFVEDYKIVFRNPIKVEIITYEKSIVGYVSYMNSLMYFDKDGIIVESTNEKLEGIPLVTGLQFGHIVLHQPLPIKDSRVFGEILNLTQLLSVFEIAVDRIDYNSDLEVQLTIGSLDVELGKHSDINGKISELNDILQEYSDLDGTLYLDDYDENNANPMYRFQKR